MNLGELTEHIHRTLLACFVKLRGDGVMLSADVVVTATAQAAAAILGHQTRQFDDDGTLRKALSDHFNNKLNDYHAVATKGGCAGCVLEGHTHHEPLN